MTTKDGWVQGYNAQVIVNPNQIVLACEVSQDASDVQLYEPMNDKLTQSLTAAGITAEIELELADAGYCSEHNLTAPGPDRLIATTKDHQQRRAARELGHTDGPPPPDATPIEEMEHLLRTPQGAAAYKQRSSLIEPVFGDRKHNRQIRRFRRRGLTAVRSEWAFIHLAGNMSKALPAPHRRRDRLTDQPGRNTPNTSHPGRELRGDRACPREADGRRTADRRAPTPTRPARRPRPSITPTPPAPSSHKRFATASIGGKTRHVPGRARRSFTLCRIDKGESARSPLPQPAPGSNQRSAQELSRPPTPRPRGSARPTSKREPARSLASRVGCRPGRRWQRDLSGAVVAQRTIRWRDLCGDLLGAR